MRTLLIVAVILMATVTHSQQNPRFSSDGYSQHFYNPASYGTWNMVGIRTFGRLQWVGVAGAPKTIGFSGETRFVFGGQSKYELTNLGSIGVNFLAEEIGGFRSQRMYFPMNYHFKIKNTFLSVGVAPGFIRQNWSVTGGESATKFDMNAGVFWYSPKYYAGFSITHLFNPAAGGFQYVHQYDFHTAYKFNVGEGTVMPLLMTSLDGAGAIFQIMGYYEFKDELFRVGTGWTPKDAIHFAAGAAFKGFQLNYVMDINLSPLSNYGPLSHEVRLGYKIPTRF